MTPKNVDHDNPALWKNHINRKTINDMADKLGRTYKKFDRVSFLKAVLTPAFFQLELKERIEFVGKTLGNFLPSNYSKAVDILVKVAPQLDGFHNWILTGYVELFGIDDFEESMRALEELTKYGTGEFAIRPFIIRYEKKMLKKWDQWAKDENEHIRRLAAEACRPRGVWVAHLPNFKSDPTPVVKLLDKLKADDSLYVRKAVANCLNDISRDNPEVALDLAHRWKKDKNELTDWIIKRGCRTLIKDGNPRALALMGFHLNPIIHVSAKWNKKQFQLGEKIECKLKISSQASKLQKLSIDYRIYYLTKSGKLSIKTFKLAVRDISNSESIMLTLRHTLTDNSTRKHNPGQHKIEIIINGEAYLPHEFKLSLK